MSIRGDRGPRDQMAMPAEPSGKRENGYRRTGRYGRGPGDQRQVRPLRRLRRRARRASCGSSCSSWCWRRLVLVALVTVARPIARLAVVALAEDNPSALRSRSWRTWSARTSATRSRRPRQGLGRRDRVHRRSPATRRRRSRPSSLEAGVIDSERAFLFEAREHGPRLAARRRALQPRRQPHAGPGRDGPRRQPDRDDVGPGDLPRGPPAGADHGEAAKVTPRTHGGRPGGRSTTS